MATEPSDDDDALAASRRLLRAAQRVRARIGVPDAALLASGVTIGAASRSPVLTAVVLTFVAAMLASALRGGRAASALIDAARVEPAIVMLASPFPNRRKARMVRRVFVSLGLLLVATSAASALAPYEGTEIGSWVAGPGLTSDGRAGMVWYEEVMDPTTRRDRPPVSDVLAEVAIGAFVIWFGVLCAPRRIGFGQVELRDAEVLRGLLADPDLPRGSRPYIAAELVLTEPTAPDAIAVARTVRSDHGDHYLRGWSLALAQLRSDEVASAKETLASTYAAIADPRRIIIADTLAAIWGAAGDRAMADAYRNHARRLARRAGYRRNRTPVAVEPIDGTLVTNDLDRRVSKNRA